MLEWLKSHQHNPYPNEIEKEVLMAQTGLSISQINYWFTNARRRILPKWMLQRYLEDQAIASGEDPSKIKVTGNAQEVRQIAKDMLQGRALPYLGRPTQSPSPPTNVRSPSWPPSEEVRNYAAPSPSSAIQPNYFNGSAMNNNRVFQSYNGSNNQSQLQKAHLSQYQNNLKNEMEGDLISFGGDTYSNGEVKVYPSGCGPRSVESLSSHSVDLLNGNYAPHLQRQRSDASSLSIKESCDTSDSYNGNASEENRDHLKTNVTDLSFLLS